MNRPFFSIYLKTIFTPIILIISCSLTYGQAAGSRGGMLNKASVDVKPLDPEVVANYITVEGKVEVPLAPTKLRAILALVTESKDAAECQNQMNQLEEKFQAAVAKHDLHKDAIVMDFINVLPLYEWTIQDQAGKKIAMEKPAGFRMQTNAHIEVDSDKQLRNVLKSAFEVGVTDVIGVDYTNESIDDVKKETQAKALKVAQEKANTLLSVVFEEQPRPINIQQETRVVYPFSKYRSFERTRSQELRMSYSTRQQLPSIQAAKPQNTYYGGFNEQADIVGEQLPMNPSISVVTTVRLYFATPAK